MVTAATAGQRTVWLRVAADVTAEEVARISGRPEGAVRASQRRGLSALRRLLQEPGAPR